MDRETEATAGPLLDLAAIGGRLVTEALVAAEHDRLAGALAPILAALPEESRGPAAAAAAVLTDHIARLGAGIEALRQEIAAQRRSRETLLRIDPLVFMEPDRGAPPPPPASKWETSVLGDGFVGFNWHHAERDDQIGWRWAGPGPISTVLVPTLGGGRLRLSITIRMPFGKAYDEGTVLAFLDGRPVPLLPDDVPRRYSGVVTLPADDGAGRATLLLQCRPYGDPRPPPLRDTRELGIGLVALGLERLEPPPDAPA